MIAFPQPPEFTNHDDMARWLNETLRAHLAKYFKSYSVDQLYDGDGSFKVSIWWAGCAVVAPKFLLVNETDLTFDRRVINHILICPLAGLATNNRFLQRIYAANNCQQILADLDVPVAPRPKTKPMVI